MGAVWVRLRSDLRARWSAIAVLTLLTGLFGGLVLATAAGARRTATAYSRFTDTAPDYDVFIVPEEAVDELAGPMYDEVAQLPEVQRSARITAFQIYGLDPEGRIDQFVGAQAVTTDPSGSFVVGNPRLLAGRMPRPDKADEALVNRFMAERLDLRPGSHVTMRVFRGTLPANPAVADIGLSSAVTFTVAGIGAFTNDVVPTNLLDSIPRLYLSTAGAATYGNPQEVQYAGVLIQLRPGTDLARFRDSVEAVQARHPDVIGDLNFGLQDGRRATTERAIRPQAVALGLFALLAGATSLFVIGQLLARQIVFSAEEFTTLRALGMARRDLFALSLAQALAVAVSGSTLAIGIAVAASSLFPIGPARLAEPHPGVAVNLAVLGMGAALMVAVLLARVIPAAWRLAAIRRQDAAAAASSGARRPGLADMAAVAGCPPAATIGTSMAVGSRRGAAGGSERRAIVATAVALAGLSAALVFGANLSRFLTTPERYGRTWDVAVDFQYEAEPAASMLAALDGNPAVTSIAGGNYGLVAVGGVRVPAVGIDGLRGSAFPTLLEGRPPSGPDEIALGSTVLERNGLSLGDTVEVGIGDVTRQMRVVGRPVFPLFGQAALEPTGLGEGAAVTGEVLGPAGPGVAVENYNFFLIGFSDGSRHAEAIAAADRAIDRTCRGVCLIERSQAPGEVVAYGRVRLTPLALAGVLAVLTVATLAQSLVSSIRRRRRDLALLKALGFVPRQVLGTVAWQATAVVVLASVIGLPLGTVAGRWAWIGLATELGVAAGDRPPLAVLLLLLLSTLLVANLVALGPGRVAARMSPATALRVE